jgi:hypothetical protein
LTLIGIADAAKGVEHRLLGHHRGEYTGALRATLSMRGTLHSSRRPATKSE